MDSKKNSDDILHYLEDLKISAFQKVDLIKDQIQNVTLGPNANSQVNNVDNEKISSPSPNSVVQPSLIQRIEHSTTSQIEGSTHISESGTAEVNKDKSLIPFRQVIKEYEFLRQQKVQEAVQNHSKKFELFSAQQTVNRQQNLLIQQQKNEQKIRIYEESVNQALKKYDEEKLNEQKKISQYEQKLEFERKKIAAAIEAKKRETTLLNHCLAKQSKFQSIFQEIMGYIEHCQDNDLKVELSVSWEQCKELNDLMTALMEKCKEKISEQEKDMIEIVSKRMIELQIKINETIKTSEENKIKNEVPTDNSSSNTAVVEEKSQIDVNNKVCSSEFKESPTSSQYMSKKQLEIYTELINFHKNYVNSFKDLLLNDKFKQFRFECKKAVNLSVNTISAASSEHLHDKYVKLSNLLSGKNAVIGDLQITASKHPKGVPFCIDLLAKKFVLQGDLMISGNPESAFAFATIIISIWNESPDFGKILLAYFFKECVYLIPFYPPRIPDQTDEDYYKIQGYRFTDGKVEEQDKFLKRISGTMRLFFAILLSSPTKNQNNHPFSINHAWTWCISVLKLESRVDITATMFHSFFETIGFEMQKVYGRQFSKIMRYFIEDYFPSMKKMDNGGPIIRLECLLQEYQQNGNKFNVPKGLLSKNFW